jgi:hypothetical protein
MTNKFNMAKLTNVKINIEKPIMQKLIMIKINKNEIIMAKKSKWLK